MARAHTYYLAYRDSFGGALATVEALQACLRDAWATHGLPAEPGLVDGVSAWLDDAGAVQIRVVRQNAAAPVDDDVLRSRIATLLAAPA